jgi:hypothetical protein
MLCLSKNEASREKKSGRGARYLYSQSVKVACEQEQQQEQA